jgi:hypothetical protein
MKKIIFLLITLIIVAGCSSVDYSQNKKYPDWVMRPSYESGIAGVGSAKITELGFDFARKEAMASARSDLARQVSLKVNSSFKSYTNKVGIGDNAVMDKVVEEVYEDIVSQNLINSRIEEAWENSEGDLYLMMVIENVDIIRITSEAVKNIDTSVNPELEKLKAHDAEISLHEELENFFN